MVHRQLHVIRNTAHRPSTQASYTTSPITNLSHLNFTHTHALQLNEQPYNTAPTKPLHVDNFKSRTSSLPLSTQTQHPMHPTWQINFPPPSGSILDIGCPNQIQNCCPKTPHTILIPKFSKPSVNVVDCERCWRRMEVSLWPHDYSELNAYSVRSLISL